MKIPYILILATLLTLSCQFPSYNIPYPHLSQGNDPSIKCMQMQHNMFNIQGDADDYYLCTQKQHLWIVNYLHFSFNKNNVTVTVNSNDQIIQRLKTDTQKPGIILAQQQDDKINMTYYIISVSQDQKSIIATNVTLPDYLNPQKQLIQQLILQQIQHREQHEGGSKLFRNAVILIVILGILVFGAYWWKRKQLQSNIQKPADLQQAMLSKMELQAQEERRKASSSNNPYRKSQPMKMTQMNVITPGSPKK